MALYGDEKADGLKPLDTGVLSGHIWAIDSPGRQGGPNMSGPGRSCQPQRPTVSADGSGVWLCFTRLDSLRADEPGSWTL
jgi:hypothetical protein